MENNWRDKSLQDLEKDHWSEPPYDSQLVQRCHELRKAPISQFTTEDLRIVIGQDIGLQWLIPLALEKLEEDILAEGDCYPGDLLKNVTRVPQEFWESNPELHIKLKKLIADSRDVIDNEGLKITD
jgi:hypothetical protein